VSRDLDRYADDYARDYGFERWQVEYRRRAVLQHTAAQRSGCVLEVGCGLEPLFVAVPTTRRWHVVEPSAAFAASAREHARMRPEVEVIDGFLETSLESLVEARGREPFSLIVVSGVLQEVPDPTPFLGAIRALCTAETIVHINVPNAQSLHRTTAVAMGLLADVHQQSARGATLQQRVVYDAASLRHEVERAGFRVVDSGGILLKPFEHTRMLAAMDAGILTTAHLDAYAALGEQYPALASEIWVHLQTAD
jgi:2-polyprenyl-3-methyl-5-hydroxy-6-metoxy-1,4-benzoquinol methylase